ncbi:MAG TPA: hypothetical protein VMJ92_03995 [Candidatus Limnocylindrales bacterium]|nr:hypothetical protein [Candidatus Limnocylindrales bacterium]
MSGDREAREDWARSFERMGFTAIRCAGPSVSCALLCGAEHCPLHESADLAVYDERYVSAELAARLQAAPPPIPIGLATDRILPDGTHEPRVERLLPGAPRRLVR